MRAGRGMSWLSRLAAGGRPEGAILGAPRRDVAVTAVVLALTAVVFVLVADHGILVRIQRVDDTWLRLISWLDRETFGFAQAEGWLHALGYYATRDPRMDKVTDY